MSATVPDVLLRRHLEIDEPTAPGRSAEAIRAGQQAGGCWPLYEAGPGDLGLTAAAYVALRIAGDPTTAPHLRRVHGTVMTTLPRAWPCSTYRRASAVSASG